jgi:hypothetical protein
MGRNSKRRRSTASGTHYPDSTPYTPPPNQSTRPSSSTASTSWLTSLEVLVLTIIHLVQKHKFKPVEIILLVTLIFGGGGLFVYWVVWPFVRFLLDYPLAPVRWILVKAYNAVSYLVSWVIYLAKGAAWCAFYLHFLNKFAEGVFWGLEKILDDDPKTRKVNGDPGVQRSSPVSPGHTHSHSSGFGSMHSYPAPQSAHVYDTDEADDSPPPLEPLDPNDRVQSID